MCRKSGFKKWGLLCLAGITAFSISACGGIDRSDNKLIVVEDKKDREVSLFSPMEKTEANVEMWQEARQTRRLCWRRKSWV